MPDGLNEYCEVPEVSATRKITPSIRPRWILEIQEHAEQEVQQSWEMKEESYGINVVSTEKNSE